MAASGHCPMKVFIQQLRKMIRRRPHVTPAAKMEGNPGSFRIREVEYEAENKEGLLEL
jgi:hypothetical protein